VIRHHVIAELAKPGALIVLASLLTSTRLFDRIRFMVPVKTTFRRMSVPWNSGKLQFCAFIFPSADAALRSAGAIG
jgi:hypothetical protein